MSITSALSNVKVSTKVMGAFGLVLLVILGLGLTAVDRLSAINDRAADIRDNWLPSTAAQGRLVAALQGVRVAEARRIIVSDPRERQEATRDLDKRLQAVETRRAAYEPLITPGTDDVRFMREFDAAWAEHKQLEGRYFSDSGLDPRDLFTEANRQAFIKATAALDNDMNFNITEAKKAADAGASIYGSTKLFMFGAMAAAMVLCLMLAYVIVNNVSVPIRLLNGAMSKLAAGDWGAEVPGAGRADELGDMAKTVEVFKTNGLEAARLKTEQEDERVAKEKRVARIDGLTRTFEAKAGELVGQVSTASTELEATAQSMTGTAGEATRQASSVADAAEKASANVQTVAAAAEELASSITEISRQVAQSAKVAGNALEDAKRTDIVVQALTEGAQKIGEVVSLISNIAGQTNLLALNATIEAARAGDAGKGFAVVASEVKNLATQTARATEDIARQITQIQSATKAAVESIRGISGTIGEISDIAASIAAAVEEQGAATQEIARNVQEAAAGTQNVSANIGGVSQGANDTGAAASQVLGAAGELSRQAAQLRSELSIYINGIKAA